MCAHIRMHSHTHSRLACTNSVAELRAAIAKHGGMSADAVGAYIKEMEAKGVDIMIALDVSRSMMAEDLGMSRLDLAKRTIERIVGSLDGDRAGLVVFAGDAYVQAPLTLDLAAVKLFLDAIGPEAMPVQGTAIGAAIEQCVASFDPESQASKVVLSSEHRLRQSA